MKIQFFLPKMLLWLFWLPLAVAARPAAPAALPQEMLAAFLQKQGILQGPFTVSANDIGFSIDTVSPKSICCDALFMEVLRSHLQPEQIAVGAAQYARRAADTAGSVSSILYKPFEAGNLIFVLVENATPGARSASLVVVKKEDGIFSVVEQSPLCRARRSALDGCRK